MKKLLTTVFALSLSWGVFAQIVNIPDANFKQALIDKGVDTSGDGEIQKEEAESVDELNLYKKEISDLKGIESFKNLKRFNCNYNSLTSIDLSGLENLEMFSCNYNSLTSLNLNGLTKLTELHCSNNIFSSLNVNGLINLTALYCQNNFLTSLDVSTLTNLIYFNCDNNSLTSLDVSSLINLSLLWCRENSLMSLDLKGLTKLEKLDVAGMNLPFEVCIDKGKEFTSFIGNENVLNENCGCTLTTTTISSSICDGDSYILGTQTLSAGGAYTEVLTSMGGCDSTVELSLNILPVYNKEVTATIFEDDLSGVTDLESTHTLYLTSSQGCDSTVTLTVVRSEAYSCKDTVSVTVHDTLVINQKITATEESFTNAIKVYPNPSEGMLFIDNGNYQLMDGYSIRIISTEGVEVFSSYIDEQLFSVNLTSFAGNGLYFIELKDTQGNKVDTRKIVLK